MQYQDKLLLDKIVNTNGPMAIVEYLSQYLRQKGEQVQTGMERYALIKTSNILNKSADLVAKAIGDLRSYEPKRRIYDSIYYSSKHYREISKK